MGWGSQPYFSEYSKSGKLLLDASFPSPDLSYRATVGTWVGLAGIPAPGRGPPGAGATCLCQLERGHGGLVVEGPGRDSQHDLSVVADAPRTGFETSITVKGQFTVFEVQAVNSKGQVIGTSKLFR